MLATPAAELHSVALRMSGYLLREAAYETVMLGADVPPQSLAHSASRHEPHVICLSSTMAGGDDQIAIAIHEVQQERPAAGCRPPQAAGITSRLRSRARDPRSATASRTSSRPSTRSRSVDTN